MQSYSLLTETHKTMNLLVEVQIYQQKRFFSTSSLFLHGALIQESYDKTCIHLQTKVIESKFTNKITKS